VIVFWALPSQFPGRLAGEQAHDLDQRRRCRTVSLVGICANRRHGLALSRSGSAGLNGQIESYSEQRSPF
jgi:hypothetical protein